MVIAIKKFVRNLSLGGLVLLLAASCLDNKQNDGSGYLTQVLSSQEPAIKTVMDQPQEYELHVQLLLPSDSTLIREDLTTSSVVDYSQGQYFYPASTVKLPVAVIAAEWTEYQDHIGMDTPYRIDKDTSSYTLAQDIIDIFSVSDNQAFNRLYDLLGRDYVNQRMEALNVGTFRLAHRLSVSDAANATHPKYYFESMDGIKTVQASPDRPLDSIHVLGTKKGLGYMDNDSLVRAPMNFSRKNYFPLATMMQFMNTLFPFECDGFDRPLYWSKNTERYVTKLMSTVPREQGYNEVDYPDGYVKFFFLGDSNKRIDPALNIYNKVGYAYGTLTDIAYIVDSKHKLHYILGATLLVNENGVFNDNLYEYDSIGLPFLGALSRNLHQLLINAKTRR